MRGRPYAEPVADPITDGWNALVAGNTLCILGAIGIVVMFLLILVILKIRRTHKEAAWAHNPDKTFKLKWRRG